MKPIDQWLCSEESGKPFCHCIHCQLPLLEIDRPWLVNKEYHQSECILEYAICKPCRDRVAEPFSEQSKASIRRFMESEIDWQARLQEFMLTADPVARLDACIACRTPRAECGRYGISALLDSGGQLVCGPLPLMICGSCTDRMTAELSNQSRDVWRGFIDDHFSGPPGETNPLPLDDLLGLF